MQDGGSWFAVNSLPRLLQSKPGRRESGFQNRRGLQRYGSHHGESLLRAVVLSVAEHLSLTWSFIP